VVRVGTHHSNTIPFGEASGRGSIVESVDELNALFGTWGLGSRLPLHLSN